MAKKNPIKKLNTKAIKTIKKIVKEEIEEKFDVICPLLKPNPEYFYNNVETWFKEIPINKLYFGCTLDFKDVEKLQKQYPEIEIIDQSEIDTLGKCIAELMKLTTTKWFIFLHADVELTPYCFEVMKCERDNDVGIIESNRVIWDGKKTIYPNYVKTKRSYSGFQLFQKKAVEGIISRIEDDWIFRNEDLIFQNFVEHNGYRYIKSYAMHIHQAESLQITNHYITKGEKKIRESQFKGYIKYTIPEKKILIPACLVSITNYLREFGMDMYDFYQNFCIKYNDEWSKIILNNLTGGTPIEELKKDKRM